MVGSREPAAKPRSKETGGKSKEAEAKQRKKKSNTSNVTCEKDMEGDPAYPKILAKLKEEGFQVTKKLGSGSYSVVLRATKSMEDGETKQFAVKVISTRVTNEYVQRFLPREMQIVTQLQHQNVLKFFAVRDNRHIEHELPYVVFVTEFAEGGDLLRKIQRLQATGKKGMDEPDMKITFHQLIDALDYLDQRHIVHRDLKCENIMLDSDENVKLGDFGFARVLHPNEKSNTFCGSRAYVAPEIILGKSYRGRPADVWSVGIIMYVSTNGHFPWDEKHQDKMITEQLQHKVRFSKRWTGSKELKKIIMDTLQPIPEQRPSYAELMNSDFLKNATSSTR